MSLCSENCGDKLDAFLSSAFHINGGHYNANGMKKLNSLMEEIEVTFRDYRYFVFLATNLTFVLDD